MGRAGDARSTHWIGTRSCWNLDLDEEPVRYRPRPPVPTKLDPYKGIITARLDAFPALTAQRLFDEVRAAGSPGGDTPVKASVRQVRPRSPVAPVVRFETPLGYPGQVDFGTFTLPWGRRPALLIVLGYSRLLWLQFFPRQTMAVLNPAASRRRLPPLAGCPKSCCLLRCGPSSPGMGARPRAGS